MPHALLIDDEHLARDDLRRLLAAHPHVVVGGEADSLPGARDLLARAAYDLVFLDIDLAGASGFDVVPFVAPNARIIFVTAHSAHAVRAFEVNALDYLLKPVSAERLGRALARLALPPRPAAGEPAEPGEAPLGNLVPGDRVFLKNERGARFVPVSQLAAIVSCDNYTEVYVADGAHYLVRRSLKAWEVALPVDAFVRVHRQAVINLTQLERLENADGTPPALYLRGMKHPVMTSHRLSPDLLRRLAH
jgi:two-component system LytT family response regulator